MVGKKDQKETKGGCISLVEQAKEKLQAEKYPEAAKILCERLDQNPEDGEALFLLGFALLHEGSYGLAYNVTKRSADVNPGNAAAWHNMGKCFHEVQKDELADECFRRAVKLKPDFPNALEGLSMSALHRGEFDECIHLANRALAEKPDLVDARVNRGMAYLALKRWREGWRDYDANLGIEKNRREMKYGSEPRWDGSKGLNVVCYGEQGIGDEISFASCLPDLIRDSKSVTLEVDKRLAPLFQRSFPTTKVYGTRYKPEEARGWARAQRFDARVALAELPKFYRNKDSDFQGKPYLIPRPDMASQWKTLLDGLGDKPKIGIAWTGGIPKTGQRRRSVTLDTFAPLFKGFDADWISLQYKEETEGVRDAEEKYGIKIHDWEWGTRYWDYDQTVSLISQLDLVISVCTAVVDASGGLGKECWCLVPEVPMWRHLASGDWYPWSSSVKLYRQKRKEWPIHLLAGALREKFGDRPRNQH